MSAPEQDDHSTHHRVTADAADTDEVLRHLVHAASNSLNTIATASQLASVLMADDRTDKARIALDGIETECLRTARLLRDGRAFASYRADAARTAVDIRQLLTTATASLDQPDQVHLQVSADLPSLSGDAEALQRLFTELLHNACQGGASRIDVHVHAVDAGRAACIEVHDDGAGVEADPARLFEPFFTSRREDHSGLGLARAARIATAHDGLLQWQTEPHGSTFVVTLPAAKP